MEHRIYFGKMRLTVGSSGIPSRQIIIILFAAVLFSSCHANKLRDIENEPVDPDTWDMTVWKTQAQGLQSGFGSLDIAYNRSIPPSSISESASLKGWKGEKISCKLIIWNSEEDEIIKISQGVFTNGKDTIQNDNVDISVIRYVLTDEFLTGCGYRDKDSIPVHISPDLIDNTGSFILKTRETRPIWISIDIPAEASPGNYRGSFSIISQSDTLNHSITLQVQNMVLPDPEKWAFHLDLWQNPYAVARYNKVEPWSQDHVDLMKPLLRMLADAGQKCITTTLNEMPWGGQTYDPFEGMIKWIHNSDGSWNYDYSVFDQYIILAMECGISQQINCYSMVPWGNRFTWFEEEESKWSDTVAIPGTSLYFDIWKNFLMDFKVHLMEMGWLDITCIALDERDLDEMKEMFSFIRAHAPELKVSMAGHYFEEINELIYDFSYNWRHITDSTRKRVKERRKSGQISTYYVACGIPEPNNFTFSPPAQSCYEGWFSSAMGFDGFLRWAYNSWPEQPVTDSRFRTWPAGDTYFVYPGARSSIRFERLREGIQDYEKVRIIKERLSEDPSMEAAALESELNSFLNSININTLDTNSASDVINKGKDLLYRISSYLGTKFEY